MAKPVSKLSADEVRAEIAALEERSELETSEQARLSELRDAQAKFEAEEDADADAVVVNVEFPGADHDALAQRSKAHNRSKRAQILADCREAASRETAGGKSSHEQLRDTISMRSAIDKDEHPQLHQKLSEQISQLSEKCYGCKPEPTPKPGKGKKGDPEPEPKKYDPERDGERRVAKGGRRNVWDALMGLKGKPPKGPDGKRVPERRKASERRGKAVIP